MNTRQSVAVATSMLCGFLFAGSQLLIAGTVRAAEMGAGKGSGAGAITVAFKVDPRLTRGLYMGDRWTSASTYTRVAEADKLMVEAKAQALDAKGAPISVSPEWLPANPGMVSVAPSKGEAVTITIHRAGESKLKVASAGVSKELLIRAKNVDGALQVEIRQ